MSKTGISLCGLYAALILGCVGYALLGGVDEKSRFIFLQIPIVLQSALASQFGLLEMLHDLTWLTAYVIFAGPVFLLLYLLGLIWDSSRKRDSTT